MEYFGFSGIPLSPWYGEGKGNNLGSEEVVAVSKACDTGYA